MHFLLLKEEKRFETILADTKQSRDQHFHFRYKIFCEETGFEQATAFPDEKERDQYDESSVHFIVWDHLLQAVVGAMRLVDASETRLPIEDITCGQVSPPWDGRDRAIEYSRLCIDKRYQRIRRDNVYGVRGSQQQKNGDGIPVLFHQEDNEILLRLIRAMIGWSDIHRKEFLFFLTTKALSRVLQRQHVPMSTVGPSVSHRGERVPYFSNIQQMHNSMKEGNPTYRWLVDECDPFVTASSMLPVKKYIPTDRLAKLPPVTPHVYSYRCSSMHHFSNHESVTGKPEHGHAAYAVATRSLV